MSASPDPYFKHILSVVLARLTEWKGFQNAEGSWTEVSRGLGGLQLLYWASGTHCSAILSLSDLFCPLLFFPSLFLSLGTNKGLPRWYSGKESACQRRRHGFHSWVRNIPWRRIWQPTPVFLPGKSSWTEEPGGGQSTGSQRVGHNWATEHTCTRAHTHTHAHTQGSQNLLSQWF